MVYCLHRDGLSSVWMNGNKTSQYVDIVVVNISCISGKERESSSRTASCNLP